MVSSQKPEPPDYVHAPELALLALNAAAITALTTFWDVLIKSQAANFDLAFIFFALGAMAAVYAAYCRFIGTDDEPGYEWSIWDLVMLVILLIGVALILVAIIVRPNAWSKIAGITGLGSLLTIPVVLRYKTDDGGLRIDTIRRGGLTLSVALFAGGVILAAGTLAHRQTRDLLTKPGQEAPVGSAKDDGTDETSARDDFNGGGGNSGGGGASGTLNTSSEENVSAEDSGNETRGPTDPTTVSQVDTDLSINFNFNVAAKPPRCPAPPEPPVCPPVEASKLCRCSGR